MGSAMYFQGWTLTYFATCPRTSEGNFHLSEMKIRLPTFGLVLTGSTCIPVPTTAFSIKEGSNFSGKFSCPPVAFSCPGQSDNP